MYNDCIFIPEDFVSEFGTRSIKVCLDQSGYYSHCTLLSFLNGLSRIVKAHLGPKNPKELIVWHQIHLNFTD